MTDGDDQRTYHHNADEGTTHGPDGSEPHHALNTPVGPVDEDAEAMLDGEVAEGERLAEADDRAEEERLGEGRSPTD